MGKLIVDYVSKELSFERVALNKTVKNLARKYEKDSFMFYETINKNETFKILSRKPQVLYGEKCYLVSFEFYLEQNALAVLSEKEFIFL